MTLPGVSDSNWTVMAICLDCPVLFSRAVAAFWQDFHRLNRPDWPPVSNSGELYIGSSLYEVFIGATPISKALFLGGIEIPINGLD